MEDSLNTKFFFHKWTTFAAMYVGYTLLILDRKSFSFALPTIVNDLSLDKDDLGLIVSSQNLAYTISKFLGGILSDQVSPKFLLASGLFVTGILTVGFTGFESASVFAVIWFLQGFAQGGVWPACAKIMRKWFEPSMFGTWYSLLNTTTNMACSLGPFITMYAIQWFHWRAAMTSFGLLSMVAAIGSFFLVADTPADVGLPDIAVSSDGKGKSATRGRGTWQDMLMSPFMRIVCLSYMVVFLTKTAALDWAQLYLIEEAGQTPFTGSSFISSLEVGGFIGTIIAGYTADKLVANSKRDNTRGTPRMSVVIVCVATSIFCVHCLVFTVSSNSSPMWIATIGFLLGSGLYGPISLYGVMAIEAAPSHLTGLSHAIVALSANVGAIFAGLPLSILATYVNWKGAFVLLEVLLAAVFLLKCFTTDVEYKMVPIKKKLQ